MNIAEIFLTHFEGRLLNSYNFIFLTGTVII